MLHLQKHLLLFSRHQWLPPPPPPPPPIRRLRRVLVGIAWPRAVRRRGLPRRILPAHPGPGPPPPPPPPPRFAASAASSSASLGPAPFAVADYLAASCQLTRDQALRASRKLSRLKSPSKPDAVLAFLSGFGLTPQEIATAVVLHPKLLCCKVDKTLAPRLAALKDHGLSASQIGRLMALGGFLDPPSSRRSCTASPSLAPSTTFSKRSGLAGTYSTLIWRAWCGQAQRQAPGRQGVYRCKNGVPEDDVPVVRSSGAFCGVQTRDPWVLTVSKDKVLRVSKFLMSDVGLDPEYIAMLAPRRCSIMVSEKVFMEKFIYPFKEAAPHLADDYAAACRGEVPSRFRS
ncbi:unnamed protein product [Urochloa decumbens]|uniref:Uncharacterized protein n=1 Tax=Urochloa decumbens TaxID=240449 RepID=A0ABC9DZL5_9POAL